MRLDPGKENDFKNSDEWDAKLLEMNFFEVQSDTSNGPRARSHSLSGSEPNRLFLAMNNYADMTLLSGMDCLEDGRGFALWDYNSDGWQDVVLVNPQAPRVRIFRNDIPKVLGVNSGRIAIKLVGGNHHSESSLELSNRDGVGAKIIVTDEDGSKRVFLRSIGEGRSSQNSGWVWIGMGNRQAASRIEVIWPSGKRQQISNVRTGEKLVIKETG